MSKSSIFLKTRPKNKLLSWVRDTLGGTMGTRCARVTWDISNRSGPSDGKSLMLQVKVSQGSIGESFRSLLTQPSSPVTLHKPNVFQKNDLDPDESRWMLKDTLNSVWESTLGGNFIGNKCTLIRSRSDIASEKVIVEYGSPNIAKPLHVGHLRSTVTGNYVARMCKAAGHDVKTICFLGDWGTQFGILQAGLAKWMPEGQNVISAVESLSLDELLKYYVRSVKEKENNEDFSHEALKLSAALEQGDAECLRVWKSIREKTVDHLKSFWSLFGIDYDAIQGESEYTVQSKYTENALKLLKELDFIEIGEDQCVYAVLPPDQKFSKSIKVPLVKKDGSSLYLLRDIACAFSRMETFDCNRMLYVVDKTQANHFMTLFRLLEILKVQRNNYHQDEWEKKLRHVTFGKVEGMSTRSGNFVLLSDLIREGSTIMQQNRSNSPNTRNPEDSSVATQLAISAVVTNSLKVRRNRDVKFDWNEALKPTGETGISLQYTHARLYSLEKRLGEMFPRFTELGIESPEFNLEYLVKDPVALDLAVQLVNFEDAFWSSYAELEPCILLNYLFRLTDKTSKALKLLKVQSEPDENVAATRYILFVLARRVLAAGLHIVGLQPLNEM